MAVHCKLFSTNLCKRTIAVLKWTGQLTIRVFEQHPEKKEQLESKLEPVVSETYSPNMHCVQAQPLCNVQLKREET